LECGAASFGSGDRAEGPPVEEVIDRHVELSSDISDPRPGRQRKSTQLGTQATVQMDSLDGNRRWPGSSQKAMPWCLYP